MQTAELERILERHRGQLSDDLGREIKAVNATVNTLSQTVNTLAQQSAIHQTEIKNLAVRADEDRQAAREIVNELKNLTHQFSDLKGRMYGAAAVLGIIITAGVALVTEIFN